LVERDVDETLGQEKGDGSRYGPCGRQGDGGGGDSHVAQEGGKVDVVSWRSEVRLGAGALLFNEEGTDDDRRGTYKFAERQAREGFVVKEDDLKDLCKTGAVTCCAEHTRRTGMTR
jgi:hypothetical protein